MITSNELRNPIIKGLHDFLEIPVVLSNNADKMDGYPFVAYTIINPRIDTGMTHVMDTVMVTEDGVERQMEKYSKIIHSVFSFTVIGDEHDQVADLMHKAVNYFEIHGVEELKERNIVVVEVTNVSNRDNFITLDYEYRIGFDVRFRVMEINYVDKEYIDKINLTID